MRQLQQVDDHGHAKKQSSAINPSSHLKINKDSYSIRKSPQSSLSSSSSPSPPSGASNLQATRTPPRHPHPVIIYTHSPKVIHTNPNDFMALVQKLTGLPRSEAKNSASTNPNPEVEKNDNITLSIPTKSSFIIKDESPYVITNENGCGVVGDTQVNSCYAPQFSDLPTTSFDNMSFYNNMSSNDFLGSTTPFYNYSSSLLPMPNMRSSFSSPTSGGNLQEFSEF